MALTAAEKAVGRAFRDAAQANLEQTFADDPPTYTVPSVLAVFRHLCPARDLRSTALVLHEIYLYSLAEPELDVPAGRFGYVYRAGRCQACGQSARSRDGRLVDALVRPPLRLRADR